MADLRGTIRRRRAADLTVDPIIDVISEFGVAVAEAVDREYRLDNARVEKFLKDYMAERVGMINRTTAQAVQKALRADDPETAVREVFRRAREERAPIIAQSEVDRASNFAAIDAGKWVRELTRKQWITQEDETVRETHREMHGQIRDWTENFESPSGAKGPTPGQLGRPEEDIGCRCSALPVKGDVLDEIKRSGEDPVDMYNRLREPFVRAAEDAWQQVFSEQEAAVLAEVL